MEFSLNAINISTHSELYIQCTNPTGNTELAKKIIIEEYNKYPNIIQKSKLKLINLVSNLKVKNNKDIDKYFNVSETTDPESSWMYIDVDYLNDPQYFRQCINHEIWHLYDFATSGSFTPRDLKWESLNPKNFKYGDGGWKAYQTEFENKFHPTEGFITNYAMLGIDEDKAETFMYYFTDHLRTELEDALETDRILKEKLQLILNSVHQNLH